MPVGAELGLAESQWRGWGFVRLMVIGVNYEGMANQWCGMLVVWTEYPKADLNSEDLATYVWWSN